MTLTSFIMFWVIFGIWGCALIWRHDERWNARFWRRPVDYCPTPRAIIFSLIGGVIFGFFVFLGALLVITVQWIINGMELSNFHDWFTRRIFDRER